MKPPAFAYAAPATIDETVGLLGAHGDEAKLLAGGQSLVPLLNMRLARPTFLVDLNRVSGLSSITLDGEEIAIGAMSRHHDLETSQVVRDRCPILAEAVSRIGYRAIRNRGTLGGSLAHADPVAELPCLAVTVGAAIEITGPAGGRVVAASDFFQSYLTTVLASDEVITAVRFPVLAHGEGWGFREFTRKAGDFALVGVAVCIRVLDGVIQSARIGLAGVGERPERVPDAEDFLTGVVAERAGASLNEAALLAATSTAPGADIHASTAFRRQLVSALTRRALEDAVSRAQPWH